VVDSSNVYYSKFFDVNFTAGNVTNVTDFKTGEVDMINQYVDPNGKDLIESLWFMRGFGDPGQYGLMQILKVLCKLMECMNLTEYFMHVMSLLKSIM
jgi:hypothetical protein